MDRNEAIEIVREYYPSSGKDLNEALETLIPELKESEDERIRKALILYIKYNVSVISGWRKEELIAWLEKQGEHNKFLESIQIGDEVTRNPDGVLVNLSQFKRKAEQGSQNLANSAKTCKIEPKFKVGDWIVQEGVGTFKIIEICKSWYEVIDCTGNRYSIAFLLENGCHLWTIQDAKDGDILVSNQIIIIFKNFEEDSDCNFVIAYAGIDISGRIQTTNKHWLISNESKPATQEQSDFLFQKMEEAGYEWDVEKKELKKIEQKSLSTEETELNSLAFLTELGYTCIPPTKEKPAWSESDEEMIKFWNLYYEHQVGDMPNKDVVENLEKFRDWLKSLKERVQLRQEWSEKNEAVLDALIRRFEGEDIYVSPHLAVECLKSLKSRYTWKPSDEQMDALDDVISSRDVKYNILSELWNELKKLK